MLPRKKKRQLLNKSYFQEHGKTLRKVVRGQKGLVYVIQKRQEQSTFGETTAQLLLVSSDQKLGHLFLFLFCFWFCFVLLLFLLFSLLPKNKKKNNNNKRSDMAGARPYLERTPQSSQRPSLHTLPN